MRCFGRLAVFFFALVFALPAVGEIYKWKDKDGKVHFSDMPPKQVDSSTVIDRKRPPAAVVEPDPEPEAEGDSVESPDGEAAGTDVAPGAPKSSAERDMEFRRRREAAAEAKAKAEKEAAKAERREQDCQRARAQLGALTSGQRVSRPTSDGGRAFLSDDERVAEVKRVQELVDAFCSG